MQYRNRVTIVGTVEAVFPGENGRPTRYRVSTGDDKQRCVVNVYFFSGSAPVDVGTTIVAHAHLQPHVVPQENGKSRTYQTIVADSLRVTDAVPVENHVEISGRIARISGGTRPWITVRIVRFVRHNGERTFSRSYISAHSDRPIDNLAIGDAVTVVGRVEPRRFADGHRYREEFVAETVEKVIEDSDQKSGEREEEANE